MPRIILSLGLVLIITGVWSSAQFTPPSGGGGSSAFASLTSGTNTAATMNVGTGASIQPTGSGVVSANQVNGASAPTSKTCVGTNSSGQLIDATSHCGAAPAQTIIGSANFSISGGAITSPTYTGVVSGATYTGVGNYTINLSGVATANYNTQVMSGDPGGAFGAPTITATPSTSAVVIGFCNSGCGAFIEQKFVNVIITQ